MGGVEPRRNYRTLSYWLGSPFLQIYIYLFIYLVIYLFFY
jgi:hypothetical protein